MACNNVNARRSWNGRQFWSGIPCHVLLSKAQCAVLNIPVALKQRRVGCSPTYVWWASSSSAKHDTIQGSMACRLLLDWLTLRISFRRYDRLPIAPRCVHSLHAALGCSNRLYVALARYDRIHNTAFVLVRSSSFSMYTCRGGTEQRQ
jgi:hypothetical protein